MLKFNQAFVIATPASGSSSVNLQLMPMTTPHISS